MPDDGGGMVMSIILVVVGVFFGFWRHGQIVNTNKLRRAIDEGERRPRRGIGER